MGKTTSFVLLSIRHVLYRNFLKRKLQKLRLSAIFFMIMLFISLQSNRCCTVISMDQLSVITAFDSRDCMRRYTRRICIFYPVVLLHHYHLFCALQLYATKLLCIFKMLRILFVVMLLAANFYDRNIILNGFYC